MRIAFLLPDLRGGGAQHMVINMANEFAGRNHAVTLFVMQDAGPYKHKIAGNVDVVFYNRTRSLSALVPLAMDLKSKQPDILYAAMPYVNMMAIAAKYLCGSFNTKVVISERNYFSKNANGDNTPPSPLQKLMVGLIYPLADKIVGISKGVADDIQGYLFCGKEKVTWIHNPVVTDETTRQLSVTHPDPWFDKDAGSVFVTSGRFVAQKDQKTLLKAFARVRKNVPARLVMLGQGPLQGELEELARDLGVFEHIRFAGFVAEPLSIMQKADVFVLSSAWEGFGNVIVEALLCGLPVVSTDCPSGPAEILDNGRYGILVPVGDDVKLAQAMESALQNKADPEAQKKRAMDFSARNICNQYEELFQSALKAKE